MGWIEAFGMRFWVSDGFEWLYICGHQNTFEVTFQLPEHMCNVILIASEYNLEICLGIYEKLHIKWLAVKRTRKVAPTAFRDGAWPDLDACHPSTFPNLRIVWTQGRE